jgi:hypothetical protein
MLQLYIHALSEIRNHDPSVRESEDSSYLTPRGHCDRQATGIVSNKTMVIKQLVLPELEAGRTVPSLFSSVQLEVHYPMSYSLRATNCDANP